MERTAALALLLLAVGCEGTVYGTGPEVWSEPTEHLDDGFLFDQTRTNRIELTLDEDAEEILRAERVFTQPRNEVRGRATIDGEDLGEIGIRLRGGLGSFNRYDDKPKWELDFNEYSGERFVGLESLSLNNANEECSGARDELAFYVNGLAGVPTSRTGHVQLLVNGRDYGMAIALETQDDRWLRRNFDNNDGNFYDGGYVQAGPWPLFLDFGRGREHLFDLEEGVDNGAVDIAAVSAEVEAAGDEGGVSEELWRLVDWDRLLRKFAVEQWTANDDAYLTLANNYRIYFQTDGPMVMTPWDQDGTFRQPDEDDEAMHWSDNNTDSGSALAEVCVRDAQCLAAWAETSREVADTLEGPEPLAFIENLIEVTREGWDGDPRGTCAPADRDAERGHLVDWVLGASEAMRATWPED